MNPFVFKKKRHIAKKKKAQDGTVQADTHTHINIYRMCL